MLKRSVFIQLHALTIQLTIPHLTRPAVDVQELLRLVVTMALPSVVTVSAFIFSSLTINFGYSAGSAVERPYDPRPYDSRYSRDYDDRRGGRGGGGRYDDYRGGGGGGGGGRYRDYDRDYDRGDRDRDRGYGRDRYDDRRH